MSILDQLKRIELEVLIADLPLKLPVEKGSAAVGIHGRNCAAEQANLSTQIMAKKTAGLAGGFK
ncbi:MAG: hypothetical protein M0Q22_10230 [Sulfuritalea sp.]|jgi:hypothetical protein|nr:hypothetical protein [Sulfuritalea sp.]